MADKRDEVTGQADHDPNCWIGQQRAAGLTDDQIRKKKAEWEDQQMREFGWFGHYIGGHETLPIGVNFHTHGFDQTFKHPDVQIVVNCGMETCHNIFHGIADRIRAGERFEHGKTYGGIIKKWDVLMHVALDDGRPVLRVILPDTNGKVLKDEMTGALKFQFMDLDGLMPGLLVIAMK